jgi:hypothetical protein
MIVIGNFKRWKCAQQRPEECSSVAAGSGWSSRPSRTAAISNHRNKCIGAALLVSSDEE